MPATAALIPRPPTTIAAFSCAGTNSGRKRCPLGDSGASNGYYRAHPDSAQERLFFTLLGECLANGTISESLLQQEIGLGHVRADALALVARHRAAA